jgi:DNA-directed RNA polymerase subunit alpha
MILEKLVLPSKVELDEKTATEAYGKFTAEPYESGYGHTVGNSLRRILLSSLQGAAVTAVRVEGAIHEYSTLPGVREDVINIILNLKKLRVKLHSGDSDTIFLSANKHGVVTAKEIKENSNVEVINKDLVIAHLEPGAKLEAELEISRGVGYVPEEETSKKTRPAGFIPVAALFSPIEKVYYDVEPARVGQKTDYDRLVLEITTDGSISPKEALEQSADLLRKSLLVFTPNAEIKEAEERMSLDKVEEPSSSNAIQDSKLEELLDQSVDLIELSSRAANCLKAAKLKTVRELVKKTDEQLKGIKNFGSKSLDEIKERLGEMGLSLGMDV